MIDGILPPRRRYDNLPPRDRQNAQQTVVGDHSKDNFVPPEQVAAAEEQQPASNSVAPVLPQQAPPPKPKRSLIGWLKGLSVKQKILFTLAAALIVSGGVIGAYFAFFAGSPPAKQAAVIEAKKEEPPKPVTVASNLTGLQVDPALNELPVTAVMIENSTDARPQAGLSQAGVVFEAIAEGGITRFVALFQDTSPDYVGPVRSARPYYLEWMLGFDANYAHAGGSPEALADIPAWGVRDLNHNSTAFWRVSNRVAPHNLYTDIAKLRQYATTKGYGKSSFTPLARKAEQASTAPTAKTINFNVSSALYGVHYDYDPATNTYKRSEGGAAHMDEKTSAQLAPKVVVALVLPQGVKGGKYTTYATIGSGQVYVFQDGVVTIGTWAKSSRGANFTFTDGTGAALKLNPGQTWFTALGGADRISYAP